jgi:queuine tRNA-ribosyltransferase
MSSGSNWIPVLTSEAGLSLTTENWQEIQVNTASYYLDALLLKPGLSVLKTIPDLASYVNWSGPIILNASLLKGNKEGIITLVSPFDGSKIRLAYPQVIDLINHLKPAIAILPPEILKDYPQIWDNWNKDIMPYISGNHLLEDKLPLSYGVYFTLDDSLNIKKHLENYQHVSRYAQGSLSRELISELSQMGVHYLESNEPARLGLDGLVYCAEGIIDLKEEQHALQFEQIDSQCDCCTCSAQLTKAYLHHLFLHTPLLCQRFLIQHNGHYVQNSLRK